MAGATRASKAVPGTIRGDYSLSAQENVVHTSDSLENAEIELKRFFKDEDYCDYQSPLDPFKYAPDEV
jgi:nucleoside-diphosphate kinase